MKKIKSWIGDGIMDLKYNSAATGMRVYVLAGWCFVVICFLFAVNGVAAIHGAQRWIFQCSNVRVCSVLCSTSQSSLFAHKSWGKHTVCRKMGLQGECCARSANVYASFRGCRSHGPWSSYWGTAGRRESTHASIIPARDPWFFAQHKSQQGQGQQTNHALETKPQTPQYLISSLRPTLPFFYSLPSIINHG